MTSKWLRSSFSSKARVVLILATAVTSCHVATAQTNKTNEDRCTDLKADPDFRIGACNALIQSGTYNDDALSDIYNGRGVAYHDKGDTDRAMKDYNLSIQLKPKAQTYSNRAILEKNGKDFDAALKDYNTAIQLEPNYAIAYYNRGNLYFDTNKFIIALQDYNDAIRLNPNYASAWNNRCEVQAVLGQLEAALADCNESLRLRPAW